jgi:hypothetical protein
MLALDDNVNAPVALMNKIVSSLESDSWRRLATKTNAVTHWEYEDYWLISAADDGHHILTTVARKHKAIELCVEPTSSEPWHEGKQGAPSQTQDARTRRTHEVNFLPAKLKLMTFRKSTTK